MLVLEIIGACASVNVKGIRVSAASKALWTSKFPLRAGILLPSNAAEQSEG